MTSVRTPHAVNIWNEKGRKGFSRTKSQTADSGQKGGRMTNTDNLATEEFAAGFTPQRGTEQGDVMCPVCWAAVFDILLTALELDEETTLMTWVGAGTNAG